MAAVLIMGFLVVAEKVEKRREAKRLKRQNTEDRYAELEKETKRRLSRTQSGNVTQRPISRAGSDTEEDAPLPPNYEDAVAGTRGHAGDLAGRSGDVRV
jgi:hypothetical protein